MKKAVVLTTHSFFDKHVKVGMEYISLGLADNGWKTDHISLFSSPLDLIGSRRRERFARVWVKKQYKTGFDVAPNLKEFAFRALFPANRSIMRYKWQARTYALFLPRQFKETVYDVCIFDITPSLLLLPLIKARNYIFRLNDLPEGFSTLPPVIKNIINNLLNNNKHRNIWAVTKPLLEYAERVYPNIPAEVISNGLDASLFSEFYSNDLEPGKPKSAVFVGSIDKWVDQEIINAAAEMLPEWIFDFYGTMDTKWIMTSKNVQYRGSITHNKLPSILSQYSVGLIPFKMKNKLTAVIERPLKFYEYVAAGLGVVSTDIESLRQGMGTWASFGSTPGELAAALEKENSRNREKEKLSRKKFVQDNSWEAITLNMSNKLNKMV